MRMRYDDTHGTARMSFRSHRLMVAILMVFMVFPINEGKAQSYRYKPDFVISDTEGNELHNFTDTIPLETEHGQLFISAKMNGRKIRLCLDTGSSQGMVFAGTPLTEGTELGNIVTRDAHNHIDTVKVVDMPAFQMGRLFVSHYVACVVPQPSVRPRYDAIIGFDLINRGLCAKIDVRHHRLILTDNKRLFVSEEGKRLKYKLKWFVPHLYVSPFPRHVDEALFDTGARQLFTMNKQRFDKHSYKSKQVNRQVEGRVKGQLSMGALGTEREDEVVLLHLDRLKWDDFSFCDIHTVTTQGTSRLGTGMLDYGSMIINPHKKQMIFQPYNGEDSVVVANKQIEMAFVPRNGRASVGLIWEESEAYKAGLRQGDVIVAINGKPVPTFRQFTETPLVENEPNKWTVLTKEGETKTVVFTHRPSVR